MKFKITILLITISLQLQFLFAVEPFRFALLTDIHLSADTVSVNDLKSAVSQINADSTIAFVLVAGDVTQHGDIPSLRKVKQMLDELHVKFYAVAGNHETKLSPNGIKDFIRIFGDDKFAFEHHGICFIGFNTGPEKDKQQGRVTAQDLTWLTQRLKNIKKGKPIVLVTHYPLQGGDVENWEEVTSALRPFDVSAILTGHYHRNVVLSFGGIPGVVNRALQRNKDRNSGFSMYEIQDNNIFIYNKELTEEKDLWLTLPLDPQYLNQ